ncbi:hypothetical protein CHARACLAT_033044 [Characodon lateralis]|uniref:Secreted protein n=1 Tax=Characodon lateralis TaxID=208331 RepID=A0ABU7EYS4_9TELE|nr:hypothetical protein [Characodon lateralis]
MLMVRLRRLLRSWVWSWKQSGGSGLGRRGWSFQTLNMTRVKQETREIPQLPSVGRSCQNGNGRWSPKISFHSLCLRTNGSV